MKARRFVGSILLAGVILLSSLVPGGTHLDALGSAAPPPPASVHVLPLDANAGWTEVGTGSASSGGVSQNNGSTYPSLTVAPNGTPYVAWQYWNLDEDQGYIYVRRWNGSSWEEVGAGSASGGGISHTDGAGSASAAVAPGGVPYVAWTDWRWDTVENEIFVRRWNGSSWEEVGAGSASGGGISDNDGDSWESALAVAPNGTPYVAWSDLSGGDSEIYVLRWNGSSWEEVGAGSASGGGISNNSGGSSAPALAVAPNGTPYVAWSDSSGGDSEIYVRRWNGSSWEEVGAGSAGGSGISDNSGDSGAPSLAIAPNGTPYVAWSDSSGGDAEIYVRRWNGSSWEEVGTDSASGGGISDNSSGSGAPALAVAMDGTPYVAWNDDGDGDMEIYVRRWNWRTWEEVGVGSASGGGVSDTGGGSDYPALAAAPDGTLYVAWDESRFEGTDVYVRQWEGGGPTFSVSGHVRDGKGHPLSGVQVSAGAGITATTDVSGTYTIVGLPAAAHTLTPTRSGYAFAPPSRTASVPPDAVGQDFTGVPNVYLPLVLRGN